MMTTNPAPRAGIPPTNQLNAFDDAFLHDDKRLCMLNEPSGTWYIEHPYASVRQICGRDHLRILPEMGPIIESLADLIERDEVLRAVVAFTDNEDQNASYNEGRADAADELRMLAKTKGSH